jgi:hypothetical protein
MGRDYDNSGFSTLEAVQDVQARTGEELRELDLLPESVVRFLSKFVFVRIRCDGQGCHRIGFSTGRLNAQNQWTKSRGWEHREDLDFCPRCQRDGKADAAVCAGVRPRGALADKA